MQSEKSSFISQILEGLLSAEGGTGLWGKAIHDR